MPPREKQFDAVCLVMDIGITSSGSGFLQTAIQCASELITRKLISESIDQFAIVLSGARNSQNPLDYENVVVMDRGFTVADWELLEYVQKHIQGTDVESDWLDAVVVALNLMKTEMDGKKVGQKKIVLFSDLGCPSSDDKLDTILGAVEAENVEFSFFGPNWEEDSDDNIAQPSTSNGASNDDHSDAKKPKTKIQLKNTETVCKFVDQTNGLYCSMDDALASLLYKERRSKQPYPWKVQLEIGPDIQINATGYIRTRREAPKTWKKCLARPGEAGTSADFELKADTTFVRNNENQDVIEQDELIESHKYGTQLITVSEEDKQNFNYDGGPKNFSVIGFTSGQQIKRHYLVGDGNMVFQPTDGDEHSCVALSALAKALTELGMVAICRKVYRARSTPRLGVLVPEYVADDDGNQHLTLVFIELPYMEDMRHYQFAPLDTSKSNEDEDNLMDALIDSMMLSSEDGGDELPTENTLNPFYQYLYACLTHRAINPGQILPEVPDHIQELMNPPQHCREASEGTLEKIAKAFPLEVVQQKKEKKTGERLFGEKSKREENDETDAKKLKTDALALGAANTLTEVGSVTPVEDFKQLIKDGQSMAVVAQQLEKVIINLLQMSFAREMYSKIITCLQGYREECLIQSNPNLYNDFLREFKFTLQSEKRMDLWVDVAEANVGLIPKSEALMSNVTKEEAEKFLLANDEETKESSETKKEDDDDDDLLDEL